MGPRQYQLSSLGIADPMATGPRLLSVCSPARSRSPGQRPPLRCSLCRSNGTYLAPPGFPCLLPGLPPCDPPSCPTPPPDLFCSALPPLTGCQRPYGVPPGRRIGGGQRGKLVVPSPTSPVIGKCYSLPRPRHAAEEDPVRGLHGRQPSVQVVRATEGTYNKY